MIKGHIYIFGDIYNEQGSWAQEMGVVSLKSVVDALAANKDAEEIVVHIHSRGGDVNEGFAIHDALVNSGKKITTSIEGMCASIATIIALAGTTRLMTENSEFMIHNPWGVASGTAEEIQKYADQVKVYEEKILNFYVDKTGGDKNQIAAMMNDETTIGSSTALEMKFVTEITENVQAFALLNTKKTIEMSKEKSALQKAIDTLRGVVKALAPTALTLSTIDGKTLEIEQEGDTPTEGSAVAFDGKPAADGDYNLSTGSTITVAAGKITAVKATEAAPEDKTKDDEITALKAKIDQLEADQVASTTALKEATAILAKLKNISSTEKPDERKKVITSSSSDDDGKQETPAQAAVRRATERRNAEKEKTVKA